MGKEVGREGGLKVILFPKSNLGFVVLGFVVLGFEIIE